MGEKKTNIYLEECAYRKKSGYCTRIDDKCNPRSFKCARHVKAYTAPVMAVAPNSKKDSMRVVHRTVNDYNPFNVEYYGINTKLGTINKLNEIPALYVFNGFLNLDKQTTMDFKMLVRDINTGKVNTILVAYNARTDKHYISSKQLQYLHKQKCYLRALLYPSNEGTIPLDTYDFNEFSLMALYGYRVGKNGVKTKDRRQIIRHLLDNEILSGHRMISHLQGLIALREGRTDRDFSQAISEWNDDIVFINNYELEELEKSKDSFWWKRD